MSEFSNVNKELFTKSLDEILTSSKGGNDTWRSFCQKLKRQSFFMDYSQLEEIRAKVTELVNSESNAKNIFGVDDDTLSRYFSLLERGPTVGEIIKECRQKALDNPDAFDANDEASLRLLVMSVVAPHWITHTMSEVVDALRYVLTVKDFGFTGKALEAWGV